MQYSIVCSVPCRPNEFLPTEFSGVRGMEQKMYKEQEKLKGMKKHKADTIFFPHHAYVKLMARLPTADTIFFPVRVSWDITGECLGLRCSLIGFVGG